jgi:hypothetical protein
MVEFNPLLRQPETLDFASPSQFRFSLLKIPTVEYFATQVNIPGISFSGDAAINTRFKSVAFMGDTLDFSDLEVTFLVGETLQNYREIHDWMTGIAFPKNTQQFADAVSNSESTRPAGGSGRANPSRLMSDATLTILSNKNNPILRANFTNCYPTSLSGLNYNTQQTDTEQLTATVTFKYDIYEFEVL